MIGESWLLIKASSRALLADPTLKLLFVIKSVVSAMLVSLPILRANPKGIFSNDLPVLRRLVGLEDGGIENLTFDRFSSGWFLVVAFGLVLILCNAVGDSSMIATFLSRNNGLRPTVSDSFKVVSSRFRVIAGFALIEIVLLNTFQILANMSGSFLKIPPPVLSWIWILFTALALPILVSEGSDPISAIRRSALLVCDNLGVTICGFVLIGIAMVVGTVGVFLVWITALSVLSELGDFSDFTIGFVIILGSALFLVFQFNWAVTNIYYTAVYSFATTANFPRAPHLLINKTYDFDKSSRRRNNVEQTRDVFPMEPGVHYPPPPPLSEMKQRRR